MYSFFYQFGQSSLLNTFVISRNVYCILNIIAYSSKALRKQISHFLGSSANFPLKYTVAGFPDSAHFGISVNLRFSSDNFYNLSAYLFI